MDTSTYLQKRLNTATPAYYRRPQETGPADAFLVLDLENEEWDLTMRYRSDGMVEREWHGHRQTFKVPAEASPSDLRAVLADPEVNALAERIVAGYENHWNGSNHVAKFDKDAQEALEALDEFFFKDAEWNNPVQVWEVGDWLAEGSKRDVMGVSSDDAIRTMSDEAIAARAEELENEANAEGIYLDGDVEAYLFRVRENLREDV